MKRIIPAVAMACLLTVPAAAAEGTAGTPSFGPGQPIPSTPAPPASQTTTVTTTPAVPNQVYTPSNYPYSAYTATPPLSGLSSGKAVSIGEVERMVRNNNLQVQALEETINALEDQDLDAITEGLQQGYQGLMSSVSGLQQAMNALPADDPTQALNRMLLQSNITILTSQAQTLQSQISSIEDNYEEQLDSLEQTLTDTKSQLAFAAESTFLAIKSMESSYEDLFRQRTTLGVTVLEMDKRYELGQVSALQLEETRNGLTQLDSGIATLAMNIENTKGDLNLLLGRDANTNYSLAALPLVSDAQVNAVNYNNDVKTVIRKSTEVREADDARDDADGKYAERAAKLRYDSTVATVSQNFQKLCRAVTDKRQLVTAAQSDYALAQKNFQVQETKFRNGQISQNTYDSAKATLETSANAVTIAQNNLYTAYMKYTWAMKGIVSAN